MDQPATDQHLGADETWLVDATSPMLTPELLARLGDPARPDRLAWNTLRTLALWDSDAWVAPMLEVACGAGNPLSALDWTAASVVPWFVGLDSREVVDVVVDGPEAYVVCACTLVPNPPDEDLRAAAVAALDGSLHGSRAAGLVVIAPPGSDDLPDRLALATEVELHDGRLAYDLLEGSMGWVSWPELGRLALDLAEEGDPGPSEHVRQLVTQLQTRFPAATM
jgi:hypothetical protein